MREREQQNDTDWQLDVDLGPMTLEGRTRPLCLQARAQSDTYYGRHEIVPLQSPNGRRVYVSAEPYILQPDLRLTIGLFGRPSSDGVVGQVTGYEIRQPHRRTVGTAQAWFYPTESTLVLWEAYLTLPGRGPLAVRDAGLRLLWTGFERALLARFPETRRVVTPAWEPLYESRDWQLFLRRQGFTRLNELAFGKVIGGE